MTTNGHDSETTALLAILTGHLIGHLTRVDCPVRIDRIDLLDCEGEPIPIFAPDAFDRDRHPTPRFDITTASGRTIRVELSSQ